MLTLSNAPQTRPVRGLLTTKPDSATIETECVKKALRDYPQTRIETVDAGYQVHRGEGHRPQTVTRDGCSCPHFKHVCQPVGAHCTHQLLLFLHFDRMPWDLFPVEPEPVEDRIARARANAETVRRNMLNDYPID